MTAEKHSICEWTGVVITNLDNILSNLIEDSLTLKHENPFTSIKIGLDSSVSKFLYKFVCL